MNAHRRKSSRLSIALRECGGEREVFPRLREMHVVPMGARPNECLPMWHPRNDGLVNDALPAD